MNNKNTTHIDLYIGDKIRVIREDKGISQTALGEAIGVTFQQIQKYENGKNRVSASRLLLIAQTLNKRVSYFFPGEE